MDNNVNRFSVKGVAKELSGSITSPEYTRLALIFVPVSISGTFESPVYDKIVKRWSKVYSSYRERFVTRENFKLGELIITPVSSDIWVAQALCLNNAGKLDKVAMEQCVKKAVDLSRYEKSFVHISAISLKEFPALKKAMVETIPTAGLNLYSYSEIEPVIVKR